MTKFKIFGVFVLLISIFIYRLLSIPSAATFLYIIVSHLRDYDSNIVPDYNYDGQVEDVMFTHRFVQLNETFHGLKVMS